MYGIPHFALLADGEPTSEKVCKRSCQKFCMIDCSPALTPIEANLKLEKNIEEDKVDSTIFK